MQDKVSIVTPLYNLEKFIAECIGSVLAQTHANFEMIILDDCSIDKGPEIVRAFAQRDPRIKLLLNTENSGPAVTRNRGIEAATGRYITFLDGDDIWYPRMLEKSIDTIEREDCGFVFASYRRFDENLQPLLSDFIVPDKVTYSDILKSNSISCLTAFIDMDRLGKKFMPLIRKRQDMGLWLAYLKEIDHAVGIREPLAIYRIRKGSLSRNKWDLLKYQWEFYTKVEKLNFLQAAYYMTHWVYRGIMKYKG